MSLVREKAREAKQPKSSGFQSTVKYTYDPPNKYRSSEHEKQDERFRRLLLEHLVMRALSPVGDVSRILEEEADAVLKKEGASEDNACFLNDILDDWEAVIGSSRSHER